jgi:hypothetical protein
LKTWREYHTESVNQPLGASLYGRSIYGERRRVGCINCNRWGHPGDEKLTMELIEENLEALRACRRQRKKT